MKNVVIAGGGDVGFSLARALSEEGHNVTVIEKDEEKTRKLEGLDVMVVQGNAASQSTLNKAYINSADVLIAVTASDEVNMVACSIAKNRGCHTMARINSDDYIETPVSNKDLLDCGVELAFCPELISATHISNVLTLPVLFDSPLLMMDQVRIVEERVSRRSHVVGKEIAKASLPRDVNLVTIFRNEEVLIPRGSLKLEANDRIIALMPEKGAKPLLAKLSKALGTSRKVRLDQRVKKAMIAGGSRVGLHLAKLLSQNEVAVIMIEEDPERCRMLSDKLEGVLVINGSPSDRELLREEGLSETDAFLALTDREEVNILISLLAKQHGAKRSIALIDKPSLKSTLEEMGIDLVITPRSVTLSTIMKYFHLEDFQSMATLSQGEAQVIEVKVREKAKLANRRIDSILGLRMKGVLIGAILRNDNLIIPRGDTFIHPNDRLVVFTKSRSVRWVKDNF